MPSTARRTVSMEVWIWNEQDYYGPGHVDIKIGRTLYGFYPDHYKTRQIGKRAKQHEGTWRSSALFGGYAGVLAFGTLERLAAAHNMVYINRRKTRGARKVPEREVHVYELRVPYEVRRRVKQHLCGLEDLDQAPEYMARPVGRSHNCVTLALRALAKFGVVPRAAFHSSGRIYRPDEMSEVMEGLSHSHPNLVVSVRSRTLVPAIYR